jgi:hypothetical protein
MSKKSNLPVVQFPGFKEVIFESFFTYPNMLESWWYCLEGSEQKVLDFLMRQTIGWKKKRDRIALSQFTEGIGETNKGTGLSKSQTRRAIKGLVKKGFIEVKNYRNRPSCFSLKYEDDIHIPLDEERMSQTIKDIKLITNKQQ